MSQGGLEEPRLMKIESMFNTSTAEINSRCWNPYLGISINNKVFDLDYIYDFMFWASGCAKERAAVLIVDIIQHINNEVFDRVGSLKALDKAFRKADEVLHLCERALDMLSPERRERVSILRWTDVIQEEHFIHNLDILNEAYVRDKRFRELLASITIRNLGEIVKRLDNSQVEKLSRYILNELPEIIMGFLHDGIHYNLSAYPDRIVAIYEELKGHDFFREICSRLRGIGNSAHVEVYSPDKAR